MQDAGELVYENPDPPVTITQPDDARTFNPLPALPTAAEPDGDSDADDGPIDPYEHSDAIKVAPKSPGLFSRLMKRNAGKVPNFFVAEMSRDDAEALLVEYGRHIDGAFLFRKSRGVVVLSMCAGSQLHHLKLEFQLRKKAKKLDALDQALRLDRELIGFVKHYAKKSRGLLPHPLNVYVTYESTWNEDTFVPATPPPKNRKLSSVPTLQQELDILRRQSQGARAGNVEDDDDGAYESAADVAARKSTRHPSDYRLSVVGEECEETEDAVYADFPRASMSEPPLWTGVPSSAASSMLSSLSALPSSGDGDTDTDWGKRGSITSTGSGTIYDEDHLPVSRRASAATPTPEGEDAVFEGEEQRTNSATTTSTTNTSIGNGADIASAAKLAGVVGKDFVEGGREVVATDGEHDIGLVDSDSETWSVDSVPRRGGGNRTDSNSSDSTASVHRISRFEPTEDIAEGGGGNGSGLATAAAAELAVEETIAEDAAELVVAGGGSGSGVAGLGEAGSVGSSTSTSTSSSASASTAAGLMPGDAERRRISPVFAEVDRSSMQSLKKFRLSRHAPEGTDAPKFTMKDLFGSSHQ